VRFTENRKLKNPAFPHNSEEDAQRADDVIQAANQMALQCTLFDSCVSLFQFLSVQVRLPENANDETINRMASWRVMVASQSALQVWHFRKAADALRTAVNRYESIRQSVDTIAIKRAIEITFRGYFPHWDLLRFGVAHHAEASVSRASGNKHGVSNPTEIGADLPNGAKVQYFGVRAEHLIMTVEGQELSLAINQRSVDALQEVYGQIIDALETQE